MCSSSTAQPPSQTRSDKTLAHFSRALAEGQVAHRLLEFKNATAGFLESGRRDSSGVKSADHAWFEIYEFLGKHVEDAELERPLGHDQRGKARRSGPPTLSIGDIMRAINGPQGVRGAIAGVLDDGPGTRTSGSCFVRGRPFWANAAKCSPKRTRHAEQGQAGGGTSVPIATPPPN